MLLVYVDDLIITENDDTLGRLRYLLSIEVAHSSSRIFNSQRKYITDLLAEIGKSACKPTTTPIDPNHKLCLAEGGVHVTHRALHYLRGTPDKRILFKRSGKVNVEMFTNADYAESIADQKSKHLVISHLLIDRHFIKEKLETNVICIPYISTKDQLADMLTKGVSGTQLQEILPKLKMDDIHSPA
ncbi:unnamed protein product [Spirodela intermedia]|uniref:Uncharacterized protein n=1 Tax=Spirodela intermedia TaxID=51605 RepID=A0A7I8KKZ5_SPIIN|nr:unnamed protein product [Spirodela intermedia]